MLADGGLISAQVLNEFTNVLRGKLRRSWAEVESALALVLGRFTEVVPLTAETHAVAVTLARDHGLSFYDALIVAAALEGGCERLYSEDLQNGRHFGDLVVIDPFRESDAP
jgi:predicted nucleic acid-binding protein